MWPILTVSQIFLRPTSDTQPRIVTVDSVQTQNVPLLLHFYKVLDRLKYFQLMTLLISKQEEIKHPCQDAVLK